MELRTLRYELSDGLAHLTFALLNLLPLPGHDGRALLFPATEPSAHDDDP